MTREEAMQKAARLVSISGSRNDWRVTYPADEKRPRGPQTTAQALTQAEAVQLAQGAKARIAGALLGLTGNDLDDLQHAATSTANPWRDAVRLHVNRAAQRRA